MAEPDFDKMTPEQIAEYQRQNCIFCKIVKGEIPSRKVFEDDKVLGILDIYPANKGHILLLPKTHYPFLPAIPKEEAEHMFKIIKGLSKAAKSAIVTGSSTVFIANGGVAGQQAPHFICHIVPRESGDGLDNFSVPSKDVNPGEGDKIAVLLKERFAALMPAPVQPAPIEPAQAQPDRKSVAEFILDNPTIKELIMKNPEQFKRDLVDKPDLKKIFAGIDLLKLSEMLKQVK